VSQVSSPFSMRSESSVQIRPLFLLFSYANLANQPTEIVACFSLILHVYCASAA